MTGIFATILLCGGVGILCVHYIIMRRKYLKLYSIAEELRNHLAVFQFEFAQSQPAKRCPFCDEKSPVHGLRCSLILAVKRYYEFVL